MPVVFWTGEAYENNHFKRQSIIPYKIERIDIPKNDEERECLAKQNFRNTAEDAYTGWDAAQGSLLLKGRLWACCPV